MAFEQKKQKSKRYNEERKPVWEKLKLIRDFVGIGLEKKGISLHRKVSNYWPNKYNQFSVTGVWIGYSHSEKRYFEHPHLGIGIYKDYLFVGLEINKRAFEYQELFAELIQTQSELFLKYFNRLDKDRRVILYSDFSVLGNPTTNDLWNLSERIGEGSGWLSIGESLNKEAYLSNPEKLLWIILDVFGILYPLMTGLSTKDIDSTMGTKRNQVSWDEGDEYDEGVHSFHMSGRDVKRSQAHKKLSRKFRAWIRNNHSAKIRKERKGIDVEFKLGKERVCVELKTKAEGDVKNQIRNAIGQLIEYNYYPGRETADQWIIVTDSRPTKKDLSFVDNLQEILPKSLTLIWGKNDTDFVCYPDWP